MNTYNLFPEKKPAGLPVKQEKKKKLWGVPPAPAPKKNKSLPNWGVGQETAVKSAPSGTIAPNSRLPFPPKRSAEEKSCGQ